MKFLHFIAFAIILICIISCGKKKLEIKNNTVQIKYYINNSTVFKDSIISTIRYNDDFSAISNVNFNTNSFSNEFPIKTFYQKDGNIVYCRASSAFGNFNLLKYYTDANSTVSKVVDSFNNKTTLYKYNANNYLIGITELSSAKLTDTFSNSIFYYDANNNIEQIKEYSYNFSDSVWINKKNTIIERSSVLFPSELFSNFSIFNSFVSQNSYLYNQFFGSYHPIACLYQTADLPFNFGKQQYFLPATFLHINPNISVNNVWLDSFSFQFNSKNKITSTTDYQLRGTNIATEQFYILKDTIIY